MSAGLRPSLDGVAPLWSEDFRTDPYPTYRALRATSPVVFDDGSNVWLVLDFKNVLDAAGNYATFSSEAMDSSHHEMISRMDPPRHDRLRAVISRWFTPRGVAHLGERIRDLSKSLLEPLDVGETYDVVAQYGNVIPSTVIGEILGVPSELHDRLRILAEDSVGESRAAAVAANLAIFELFDELLESRRKNPTGDMMSVLLESEVDGRKLTREELLGYCWNILVAGNDTTANAIGTGALLLGRYPGVRRELVDDMALLPAAIEEILRFDGPVQMLNRICKNDTVFAGHEIREGDQLQLVWGSANRDPLEFGDPDSFNIRRDLRKHVAFGYGVHFCLGAALARLESRIAFEEFLTRAPEYDLIDEQPPVKAGWSLRGYEHVRVHVG